MIHLVFHDHIGKLAVRRSALLHMIVAGRQLIGRSEHDFAGQLDFVIVLGRNVAQRQHSLGGKGNGGQA